MNSLKNQVQVAVYHRGKGNNTYNGDSYFYTETSNEFVCVIADGLGSGEYAQESSQIVIDVIKNNIHISESELLKKCNHSLLSKRGVVVGILKIDFRDRQYLYFSVGNIALMTITNGKRKRNIPNQGYLPNYQQQFKVMQGDLHRNMNFIMFSDGISDVELSKKLIPNTNMDELIDAFQHAEEGTRDDDTTLIAMHYR